MSQSRAQSQPLSQSLSHSSSQAVMMALGSAILMGTIGALARTANLEASIITFYRLLIGAACLIAYMLATGKARQILHRPGKRHLFNGAMLAGFMVFYVQSIGYINMANAVMLIYLAPLVSAIGAHFLFHERLTRQDLLAIGIALIGVVAILPSLESLTGSTAELKGYGFALLALLSYSGFMLINRRPASASPYQSTLIQLSFGALCLLPFALHQAVLPSLTQWFWLALIGVFPGFLAILFAVKALRVLPAATFGTLAYIEPVTVVILGWSLFAEHLTPIQLMGCGLIICAGLIQTRKRRRAPNPQ
ncbi:DMT family transporter [Shewanella spartinae]|uniref:DMT family transporter n=1 Tax=Shewanella spartinae TaxID=2864205 RepID=UPI001C65BEE3|nr:EamA family transporter [Shewanella spartinae]QYJ92267.1 DMT family transporter [Shewanella spartinae]